MLFTLITICILGFIAAAVDAIAGGGGLISLPALLVVGIPPHLALGTNKFAATAASMSSAITFARSGKTSWPILKWQIPFTLAGASLGVLAVLRISSSFLSMAVPVLILLVGIYTVIHKEFGIENRFQGLNPLNLVMACSFAFAIGFYDGFFGPGTGSFLIFAFATFLGFDFLTASANAKVLNFMSNFASLLLFAWNGKILYLYGIPMGLFMILGSYFGSKLAIKRGATLVRPIFVTMSFLVAAKLIYQAF
ncbi:TSUP family transporter [Paradesulfitobacterium aromaticivorans]